MKKLEILAPAGGPEQLTAAVRCGADAVYLGTAGFNARRGAKNFAAGELAQVVGYCHERGVRVHVTVNTLVFDDELASLEREADAIAASGADAVIIQDLAVAQLFRERYPSIKRHASTQMAVHNLEGAQMAQSLGFDRVVLARELSFDEIKLISDSVDIETEMFVHGAHCMSLSGACYLSCLIGGRSGNRGMCAQPCRTDMRVGGKSYALSLKDMSYVSRIPSLEGAGVVSLKIEGRMKRPEYVAAAVTACRLSRDGGQYDLDTLQKVFSRSGFTSGYLDGRRTDAMFGIRTQQDAQASAQVLGKLAALYRNEYPGVAADMRLEVREDRCTLSVSDGQQHVTVSSEAPQKAVSRALDEDGARRSMEKTGGTPYYLDKFEFSCPDGLFVPSKQLNAMRSSALDELSLLRGKVKPHKAHDCELAVTQRHEAKNGGLWCMCSSFRQAEKCEDCEKIILPAQQILAFPESIGRFGDRLVCAFEPVLFPDFEARYEAIAEKVRGAGVTQAWTENIYGIELAKNLGMKVYGGAAMNITNSRALGEYERLGLSAATASFELHADRIAKLGGGLPRGAIVYGYLPAMRTRACPVKIGTGCLHCSGSAVLTDRTGAKFPFVCSEKRWGTLLNSVPLYAADRKIENIDFRLALFTVEKPERVGEVLDMIRSGAPFDGAMTRGLYFRTVQ